MLNSWNNKTTERFRVHEIVGVCGVSEVIRERGLNLDKLVISLIESE